MEQTLTFSQFDAAFHNMGRGDQFTYAGKRALFDYLEEIGPDMELDVIALCCEFAEYADLEEFQQDHGEEDYPDIAAIREATTVFMVSADSFIVQQF